jgi:hypothetical protein
MPRVTGWQSAARHQVEPQETSFVSRWLIVCVCVRVRRRHVARPRVCVDEGGLLGWQSQLELLVELENLRVNCLARCVLDA